MLTIFNCCIIVSGFLLIIVFFLERDEGPYDLPHVKDKMATRKMKTLPPATNPSSSDYYTYATHTPTLLQRLGKRLGRTSKKEAREGNIPLPPVPQGDSKIEDQYYIDNRMPGTRTKSGETANTRQNALSALYLKIEEGTQTNGDDGDMYVNAIDPNKEVVVQLDAPSDIYETVKDGMTKRGFGERVAVEDDSTAPSYYNIEMTPSPNGKRKDKEHSNTEEGSAVEPDTETSVYYNISPKQTPTLDDQDLYENVDY